MYVHVSTHRDIRRISTLRSFCLFETRSLTELGVANQAMLARQDTQGLPVSPDRSVGIANILRSGYQVLMLAGLELLLVSCFLQPRSH